MALQDLTPAQRAWLANSPQYDLCGPPRPGISFRECGTLYADGRFEPSAPMKAIRLEPGCVLIGVPSDLYLTDPDARALQTATKLYNQFLDDMRVDPAKAKVRLIAGIQIAIRDTSSDEQSGDGKCI